MKPFSLSLGALLLFAVAAAAQNNGPASNGDFQFSLEGANGSIQYNAKLQGNSAKGNINFQGAVAISNEDVDGEGINAGAASNVTATVDVDCLRVSGNRAAMSGVVTSSNVSGLVGRRAVLAVEDNGEGINAPARDRFTWGVYRPNDINWIPEDAEVPGDTGWFLSWLASDSEEADTPVPFNHVPANVNCQSFGFGAYTFEDVAHGAGNIQVRP